MIAAPARGCALHRSVTTWLLCSLALTSACTALRDDASSGASDSDAASITRRITAKELRDHYAISDGSVRDARVAWPEPISQAGTRPDAAAAVKPAQPAADAASGVPDAGRAQSPARDAATVEPPPDPPPDPPPQAQPMCLPATAYCDSTAQCCGALQCDTTTLGRVCCGLQRQPCSRANGEDCCGQLSCDRTTLGVVCCGERGHACHTANGEDCCRDLECVGGRCQ